MGRIEIDFERLCAYEGIKVAKVGDRHYRAEWVSMECPFCTGDAGNHLGYSKKAKVFTCWRCGRHTIGEVLAELLHRPKKDAVRYALENYPADPYAQPYQPMSSKKADILDIPGSKTIPDIHRNYLISRRYDPDKLADMYDLRFTQEHESHPWRVIVPIWHEGKYVSYVGRDVTGKSSVRYLTCMPEKEVYDCKKCVWGLQRAIRRTAIVVEGVFDAWRIGDGGVATLGTGWRLEQAELIARRFDRSYILYDPEVIAQQRAKKLAETCSMYNGHKSFVLKVKGSNADDPDNMTEDEVKEIRKLIV